MIRITPTGEQYESLKKQKFVERKDEDGNIFRVAVNDAVVEDMIRRWKRAVKADGLIEECRRRECFYTKAEKRREKAKRAKIRRIQEEKAYLKSLKRK